ncbi:hypothetical protein JTE90_016972 [Oedothorax gibbosus]|uniref:Uncharacterized protein n=1 Tax=Oedothorax gibbosus TaxID=931172 RepID=A0AAV6UG67_9ARAC|nr:hypothetical protein JTE90_016972 [Oedothorax gibbosus]
MHCVIPLRQNHLTEHNIADNSNKRLIQACLFLSNQPIHNGFIPIPFAHSANYTDRIDKEWRLKRLVTDRKPFARVKLSLIKSDRHTPTFGGVLVEDRIKVESLMDIGST